MGILLKTPFNSDRLETNPMIYGLRETIIQESIKELFNDKSLLITGPRGIGKSSLSYQLQKVLEGDKTLLQRCLISIELPRFIIIDYTCTSCDTLESIVTEIVQKIDRKLEDSESKYEIKKAELGFSLFSMFSGKIEATKREGKQSTIIKCFIDVIVKLYDIYTEPHINIVVDELDQLGAEHNFAHFIKVVLETLDRQNINGLSFIFAGQSDVLKSLLKQQPSFHRLAKHIDLRPLDDENSQLVFESCIDRAEIYTEVSDNAKETLLKLASGYPYFIHVLGHEAFNCMLFKYDQKPNHLYLGYEDVIEGIKNSLVSCRSRFEDSYSLLNYEEQKLLQELIISWDYNHSQKLINKIPAIFTQELIIEKLSTIQNELSAEEIIKKLCDKQIMLPVKRRTSLSSSDQDVVYKFREEFFRIYLSWKQKNIDDIDYF